MNLGFTIIAIAILGYFSHYLNQKYLSGKIMTLLYYLGATVHELSHALACLITGAHVSRLKIFSHQPQVIHGPARLPLIGQPLISLAPLLGGLAFFYLINKLLGNYLLLAVPDGNHNLTLFLDSFLSNLKLNDWRTYALILFGLNSGAMLGPSWRDIKNIWPFIIVSFFITYQPLLNLGLLIIGLLIINLLVQLLLITAKKILKI